MSAVGQFRMLGGSVAIAICANVLNNMVEPSLRTALLPNQLADLLKSVQTLESLPLSSQDVVRQVYTGAYQKQLRILTAFSGAAVVAAFMLWEKHPRTSAN